MFLNLRHNQLGGTVPSELGDATALVGLLLSANRLAGTIPGSFYNLDEPRDPVAGPQPLHRAQSPSSSGDPQPRRRRRPRPAEQRPRHRYGAGPAGRPEPEAGREGAATGSQAASAAPRSEPPALTAWPTGGRGRWSHWTSTSAPARRPWPSRTSSGTGDVDLYVASGAAHAGPVRRLVRPRRQPGVGDDRGAARGDVLRRPQRPLSVRGGDAAPGARPAASPGPRTSA